MEKVARGLQWKGLAFERVPLTDPVQLRRWSPQTGKVPVLEIDGERVYDSTLILRRLEALAPDPSLWSPEPATAARQRLLEDWADESLYWQLMAERWCPQSRNATLDEVAADLPGWIRPVARRTFLPWRLGRGPAVQGFGRLPRALRLDEFGAALDDLALLLGESSFFFGEALSAADLAVFVQLRSACGGATPRLAEAVRQRATLVSHSLRVDAATSAPIAPRWTPPGRGTVD
jgi:glutathione S-transferase